MRFFDIHTVGSQLGFSSEIKVPQLGLARNLHSSARLELEISGSGSSLNYLYIFCAIIHFRLLNYFHRYTNLQISLQIFCCYYKPECAFAKGYKLFTFWPKIFSVALSILQSGFVAFCEKQQLSTNTDFLKVFHPNFHTYVDWFQRVIQI